MKSQSELLQLRNAMTSASRQYDNFMVGNGWGLFSVLSVILSTACAAVYVLLMVYPPEKLASPSASAFLAPAAVAFALLCAVAKRLEAGRRKPLEALCRDTVDNYVNALNSLLEFNDYTGEFVSLNAPESSQYRCFANRHGQIVTITVEGYENMILFQEDGQRVELFELA